MILHSIKIVAEYRALREELHYPGRHFSYEKLLEFALKGVIKRRHSARGCVGSFVVTTPCHSRV